MALPSTKTVLYKYENVISQMTLFMCWQTSFHQFDFSLSLLDLSVSWVVLDLSKHSPCQYLLIKPAMQDSNTHKQNLEEIRLNL